MTASDWALILTALGGATFLKEILAFFRGLWTGRTSRQRKAIDDLSSRAAEADELEAAMKKMHADVYRRERILRESLEIHRQLLIRSPCFDVIDLPDYPEL